MRILGSGSERTLGARSIHSHSFTALRNILLTTCMQRFTVALVTPSFTDGSNLIQHNPVYLIEMFTIQVRAKPSKMMEVALMG